MKAIVWVPLLFATMLGIGLIGLWKEHRLLAVLQSVRSVDELGKRKSSNTKLEFEEEEQKLQLLNQRPRNVLFYHFHRKEFAETIANCI